jgi:hypothetical protein
MAGPSSIIPDTRLAAIGHVANMMANLDLQIDIGIWTLIGAPQQLSACVTAQLFSAIPRMKAFTGLAEILGASGDSIKRLKTISGQISGLAEDRNRMVHDPRMIKKSTGAVERLQITAKPNVHFGFIPENDEEVNNKGNEIGNKVREFMALRDAIIAEIEALPPESRPQLTGIAPYPDKSDQVPDT